MVAHIERVCIIEAEELIQKGFTNQALTSLVLGMEWLGAVIDHKPSGAKKQSRKRFELALKRFPSNYWDIHSKIDLYRQLRNRTVHNPWVDGIYLKFTDGGENHLKTINGTVHFSLSEFHREFKACLLSIAD